MSHDIPGVRKGFLYLGVIAALTAPASILAKEESHSTTGADAR